MMRGKSGRDLVLVDLFSPLFFPFRTPRCDWMCQVGGRMLWRQAFSPIRGATPCRLFRNVRWHLGSEVSLKSPWAFFFLAQFF